MTSNRKLKWREKYANHAESYEELLSFDPFEGWDQNCSPEVMAEDEFRCGLEAWLGGNPLQGTAFIRRGRDITTRALAEKRLDKGLCRSSFPRNRGELLRINTYCTGILERRDNNPALLEASRDLRKMAQTYPEWDSQAEALYLAAVRAALIGHQLDQAQHMLKSAREFNWHKEEAGILEGLAFEEASKREESISRLEAFLETVCDPDYSPDYFFESTIARFELAVLYVKAQEGNAAPDYRAALARITDCHPCQEKQS